MINKLEDMKAFSKWYESEEYEDDIKDCHLGVSINADYPSGLIHAEIKNIKEFAEVCFTVGRQSKEDIVWHDLRINPNDLPERMGLGSKEVYISDSNGITDFACYRFDKKYWERSEDEDVVGGTVIAWCEIPLFIKREG